MIHNIAEGNRTTSRRTKDVEVEPGEQDESIHAPAHAAHTAPGDSCADLTGDTGTESDSEVDGTAQPEGGTTTAKHGPLRTPTPSQVVMASARVRAKKIHRKKRGKRETQGTRDTSAGGDKSDNNSSDSNNNSSLGNSNSSSNSAVK